MRTAILVALLVTTACGSKQSAALTDLSTLEPVRAAFNAKKGEARFLTLLSPT
jgi:hypothetical protein